MAGPEIQAAAIQTVLDGLALRSAPGWLDALIIVALGLARRRHDAAASARSARRWSACCRRRSSRRSRSSRSTAGVIVSMLYPLIALGLGFVGALGVATTVGAFERERVRDLFARFVPEAVVDDVLARAEDGLRLGGERKIVTVMFSDIRGFTTYSEKHTPEEVIEVLNEYLTIMSDVIAARGGTLVAYMGDGIMAVFGAPTDQADHADRALTAAEEMAGPALDQVNALLGERGDEPFRDRDRPELGAGDGRQRRQPAPHGVLDDRRHDEHGGAPGVHDEGLGPHDLRLGHRQGHAHDLTRGPGARRPHGGPRQDRRGDGLDRHLTPAIGTVHDCFAPRYPCGRLLEDGDTSAAGARRRDGAGAVAAPGAT